MFIFDSAPNFGNVPNTPLPEGTVDYDTQVSNKPQIAGITLTGDKSLAELGIQEAGTYASLDYVNGSMSYGIKGDYATHFGIIKCQEGLLESTIGTKDITVKAGIQLIIPGKDTKTQIASDIEYTIESSNDVTLFYSEGDILEAEVVYYSETEPTAQQTNGFASVAWFNPKQEDMSWNFKIGDNNWTTTLATPLADVHLNNGVANRIDYVGYRILNDNIYATQEDLDMLSMNKADLISQTLQTTNKNIYNAINELNMDKADIDDLPTGVELLKGQPPVVSNINSSVVTDLPNLIIELNKIITTLRNRGVFDVNTEE